MSGLQARLNLIAKLISYTILWKFIELFTSVGRFEFKSIFVAICFDFNPEKKKEMSWKSQL